MSEQPRRGFLARCADFLDANSTDESADDLPAPRSVERLAPACRESGYCEGPNAQVGVCDCHDDIWQGEKWWEPRGGVAV